MSLSTITAIIPTKNRPYDLSKAIESVLKQSLLPNELIIIDQSDTIESREIALVIAAKYQYIGLQFIHDKKIEGLVKAKDVGVKAANGEVILFLEDDIVLDPNYVASMQECFLKHPEMFGCCGLITNPPSVSLVKRFLFDVFHRGLFYDPRNKIYGQKNYSSNNLVPSNKLSGGCSAWRSCVFKSLDFDTLNDFHMLEDIDFSIRVSNYYEGGLYINLDARLQHHCSPVNRDANFLRQKRKLIEYFTFYKKNSGDLECLINFIWLLIGLFLDATYQAIVMASVDPIRGFIGGISVGFKKELRYF
jgi:GT2 family glycosyltransferase